MGKCIFWHERVMCLNHLTFFVPGDLPAADFARQTLLRSGCHVVDSPGPDVTHLLLSVPSFDPEGKLKGGFQPEKIISGIPDTATVMGGNLFGSVFSKYKCIDFLQDPMYLAENAAITAHCAIRVAMENLSATLQDMHILVIGWGRIGKCLGKLLQNLGAHVTVTSRKAEDRAILTALGYDALDPSGLNINLSRYRLVFNTAPTVVVDEGKSQFFRKDCLKIDLASKPGILDPDVICARGLPGKLAPETSGELIARTAIRLAHEQGVKV